MPYRRQPVVAATVVDAITEHNGSDAALTVVGAGGDTVTVPWAQIHDQARRMAAVLADAGLGRGCRVGLLGDTGVELICALQGVWLAGGAITVLPLSTRADQPGYLEAVLAVIADAGLDLVIIDDLMAQVTAPLRAAGTAVMALGTLIRAANARSATTPVRLDPADLAILQYTSGSTRVPRGVPVTHAHLAANLAAIEIATSDGSTEPKRMLSWLPLYHDMGLIGFLALPMSLGWPLVLQSPICFLTRPASWLQAIERHRPIASAAPNFAYRLMTRLLRAGLRADLSSLEFLLSGGEPVDPAAMAEFTAAARPCGLNPLAIVPAYGLAEATLAVSFSPRERGLLVDAVDPTLLETEGVAEPARPGHPARQLVRLGPPVSGTSVRIVDRTTGHEVGERRVGHIEIRGPAVVGHYHGEPPPTTADAWLRTGDLGYLTGGELVVCGREKDMLIVAGRNVFPHDVECVAAEVPGVRIGRVAAFGIAGGAGDRLVVALESRDADPEPLRRSVSVAVANEIGLTPAEVVVLSPGRLPRTSSGKLRRAETRQRYLSGDLAGSPTPIDLKEASR
jgi:fatty-acyl-CoA synthase